jgi:transcriptional regulator with XRE-family HTH domain
VADDAIRKKICAELARLLREERLRRKLSLNALSAKAGLNRQAVTFIERELRIPTVDTLLRLTQALEVLPEALLRKARKRALEGD